ncbi:MAG: EF-hand domain-containing protein [Spirochaetia bacterium]|nr:EF-hand domain-containing protein [Spirochaetia bacterium]
MSSAEIINRVKSFDTDGNGKITREEFKGPENIFKRLDKNSDGVISPEEMESFAGEQTADVKDKPLAGSIGPGVKALSEMSTSDLYKGEEGGLYGKGSNKPPKEILDWALQEAKKIVPLNKEGKPDPKGKVAFISLGMSNTTQEFQKLLEMLKTMRLASYLACIDGAQGGNEATAWATEIKDSRTGKTSWDELARRLAAAEISPLQVQVVWMKLAVRGPAKDGEFPEHVRKFQEYAATILQKLKSRYPNIRIVYFSNRIYAGYATTTLNPEPYAYEYAYGIRSVIQDQYKGNPELNFNPSKGEVKAPLVLWGPDLWANGSRARSDGLSWEPGDLGPDGTHPSESGREKSASQLLWFLQNDPTARIWFVKEP